MFLQRLITQMYFEGDPLIKSCPMVNSIPDINARKLLIGRLDLSKTENEKILDDREKLKFLVEKKFTSDLEKQWLRQKLLEYKVKKRINNHGIRMKN